MHIKIFLLDDHEIVRAGLKSLIAIDEAMVVTAEASSQKEALDLLDTLDCTVALLDVRLPDGSGVEVCREFRSKRPEISCIMLTSYADDDALFASVMAGAAGYVLKQVGTTDLLADIRRVARGESLIDPDITAKVMVQLRERASEERKFAALTDQERKVLALIGEGMTNRQIADAMFLAEKTVKNYVSNLLAKLGFDRRTEAAIYATRRQMGADD